MTAIIPILIYLIILKLLDGFRLLRTRLFAACLVAGAIVCAIVLVIAMATDISDDIIPAIEEVLKGICAIWLVKQRKAVFFAEALVYGATIGAGFAMLEDMIYWWYQPGMPFVTELFRGLSTSLLHMGCTALMAIAALIVKNTMSQSEEQNPSPSTPHSAPSTIHYSLFTIHYSLKALLLFALPFLLHYAYNLLLVLWNDDNRLLLALMFGSIVVFGLLFIAISIYNERSIYRWLDHSITYDVQLLAAIKQGQLTETNTGRYLMSIRNQVQPEVFFDIICFMTLYLELVIAGKARMLLTEAGMAEPLTVAEQTVHTEKLTELHTLRRNIGRMGEHILRPVITVRDSDLRVM